MVRMIQKFNTYVSESKITLSHSNWKEEMAGHINLDLGNINDILLELDDLDLDSISTTFKFFDKNYNTPNSRSEIQDPSNSWYPGFSIRIIPKVSVKIKDISNRFRVIADLIDRLDSEYIIKLFPPTDPGSSGSTGSQSINILGFKNRKIDTSVFHYPPSKKSLNKLARLKIDVIDIVSKRIMSKTGSIFNVEIVGHIPEHRLGKVYIKKNIVPSHLTTLKLRSIIRLILKDLLDEDRIEISDFKNGSWIVSAKISPWHTI